MSPEPADEPPDYGHPHRLPLKAAEWLCDDRGVILNIVRADMTDYGMSKALARLIQRLSVCLGCGHAPFPLERHAQCKREVSMRFETSAGIEIVEHAPVCLICQVVLPMAMHDVIRAEIRADCNRARKFVRKRRLSKITRRELAHQKQELFALQGARCYYCFIRVEADSRDFDHFVAFAEGATGDVWNLVVACKVCNHEKGMTPGAEFRTAMLRRLNKSVRRQVAALQAQVDAWREQKLQEHLDAEKPRG